MIKPDKLRIVPADRLVGGDFFWQFTEDFRDPSPHDRVWYTPAQPLLYCGL